ncbi:MAG: TonB-dependent receptor [Saprospiraceae bacterium]|nr:TonB-dependent receptor [Saprospiraceae bacterium]
MRSILLLTLLISSKVHAQINVSGQVLNDNDQAIPFCNIVVKSLPDSSFVKGELSDEAGLFSFALPNEQTYLIEFDHLGHETKHLTVSKNTKASIALSPHAEVLEDVVVTAKRPMFERLSDRLVVQVAQSPLATGGSAMDILQKSPGVSLDSDGNIQLNGRNGVLVQMDGRMSRLSAEQLRNMLEQMPAESIDKIELIHNPSAKYQAEGNAGIVNIITTKGQFYGLNGNANLSLGKSRFWRFNSGVDFNLRSKKYNLYGSYHVAKRNQFMEILVERLFYPGSDRALAFDLENTFKIPVENHLPKLGLDIFPNEKTVIGILYNSNLNLTGQRADNYIYQQNLSDALTDIPPMYTETDNRTNWYQHSFNFNIKHTINEGQGLEFDFDLADYNNDSDQRFTTSRVGPNQDLQELNRLLGNVDGTLALYAGTLDYYHTLPKGTKIEVGVKYTDVRTDNDLDYLDEVQNIQTTNTNLSNHFIYQEKVSAGYINLSKSLPKFSYNIGLRYEATNIQGNQLTDRTQFENNYNNLFPSVGLSFHSHPDHAFGWSMSRRIDRPSYNDLNPFKFFVNTNTFRSGNPFLLPQFAWRTEINYTLKKKYFFSLAYATIKNNLNRAIIQEGNEEIVSVTPINIGRLNNYALSFNLPIIITKSWSSRWNASMVYGDFDGQVSGLDFDQLNQFYFLSTFHNLTFPKAWRLQLNAFWIPPHDATISTINSISQISLALQKTIWSGKGRLTLNVDDILDTNFPTGRTVFGNIDDRFISYRNNQKVVLGLRYSFGKNSIKPTRRRQSKVQDLMNRARQSES